MRRALLAALACGTVACLAFRDPGGSPAGTYAERLDMHARLLRMEDRRFYDPLLAGRASASPDAWVRARTALACGRLRDGDASPFLPVLLKDGDTTVRRAAAFAIGLSGDVRLVRFLKAALSDADAETAANAAESLSKLGGAEAIEALVAAASAPSGPRDAAAHSLFRFPEESVVRALIPLASGAASVRPPSLGAPAAEVTPSDPRVAVTDAGDPGTAPEAASRVRQAALYALARRPRPEAAPVLREALAGDPSVVPFAARGLGILGDAEAVPALAALAGRPETSVAVEALLALERIGAKSTLGPEARAAALARASDPLPGVAVAAIRALGRFPAVDREGGALGRFPAVDRDGGALVRFPPVERDGGGGGRSERSEGDGAGDRASQPDGGAPAADEVTRRLSEIASAGGWRGQTALVSLARVRGAGAKDLLAAALGSAALEARLGAAEALGVLAPDAAAPLLERASRDAAPRVRALALSSASKETLAARPDLVLAALGDGDAAVRSAALEAATPLLGTGPRAVDLEKAWRKAYDGAFRAEEADYAVGALDAAAARSDGGRALLEARVDDRDPVVREKARRLLVEKHSAAPSFRRVAVETGRGLPDYLALARLASESRLFADVVLEKGGTMRIELAVEDAPMTVASFAALARRGFFDLNTIHRVVPNFVVQAGDPRGDGTGGPGYAIRDEINPLRYRRSAVGMALSGPDTGGSQWFIALAPQPHLDGGYTVFGYVVDGMSVADRIEQDDRILRVVIEDRPREARPRGGGRP